MGDYTTYSVNFERTGIDDVKIENLCRTVLEFTDWTTWDNVGVEWASVSDYEYRAGNAQDVASKVLHWMMLHRIEREFTVMEDGCYGDLGVTVTYHPQKAPSFHEVVSCDDGPVITQRFLEKLWASSMTGADLRKQLIEHFGPSSKFKFHSWLEEALA